MKFNSTVLISALVLAAAAVPAGAASVSDSDTGFYVGLDGRIDMMSWKTVDDTNYPQGPMGLGLRLGYRFSPYLATEVTLGESADENRVMDDAADRWRYRMTLREAQFDVLAYWPRGDTGWFKPFLSLGLAYTSGDARLRYEKDTGELDSDGDEITDVTYTTFFHKKEVEWRVGGGVEVRFSDSISGRIYGRYQDYDFGHVKGGATFGFSIISAI
jgi:opacity protein-like surface antigen